MSKKEVCKKMSYLKNEKTHYPVVSLDVSNFASDDELFGDLQKCCLSSTVEDQIKCLKQLSNKYLCQVDSLNCVKFVSFIVNMFIDAEPKNPIKTAVVKILSANSSQCKNLILHTLTEQVSSKVLKVGGELFSYSVNTVKCLNNLVSTLAATINFTMGQESMAKNFRLALHFLNECFHLFLRGLMLEQAPSSRVELHQCSHNAVRVFVGLYQCCHPDKYGLSSTNLETIEERTENVEFLDLQKVLCCLLIVEDLPLDVGNTCALALVTLIVRERRGLWREVLSIAVTGKNSSYIDELLSPSIATCLNLCSGLLGGLCIEDQILPLEENSSRFSPLAMILYFLLEVTHATPCKPMLELGSARGIQKVLRVIASLLTVGDVSNNMKKLDISDFEITVYSSTEGNVNCQLQDCKHLACELITNVSGDLLPILWCQLEHFLDSVRHAARGALQTYVHIAFSLEMEGNKCLALELQKSLSDLLPFRRARYIAFSAIANSGSRQFAVALSDAVGITPSELVNVITSQDSTSRPHASAAFEAIMSADALEINSSSERLQDWLQHWVQPVLQSLSKCSHLPSHLELEKLLMRAVERYPKEIVSLVLKTSDGAENGHWVLETLCSLMICLRAARVNGFFDSATDTDLLWKDILPFDLLHHAAIHLNDEVRLGALALVVETHRSTESLSVGELQVIRTVLEHSASSELASTRQRCIALFKRLLIRINDCSTPAAQRRQENSVEVAELCSAFANWSVNFAIRNLFPGANFGRRCFCLQMLNLIVDVLRDVPDALWLPSNGSVLIDMLKDPYEENKSTSLNILKHFPPSSLKLNDVNFVISLLSICEEMAKSIRPPNSVTAAYLLQMIASFPTESGVLSAISRIEFQLNNIPNLVLPEEVTSFQLHFRLLQLYSFIFKQQVIVAQNNLNEAASVGPMYGVVLCIRFLLKDLNLLLVTQDANWSRIINCIIESCYMASEAVEPIVNSSSPEGHIPMDVQLVSDLVGNSGEELNDCQNCDVTAQQVLLCAWRTVKETSLLLGWLALHTPLHLSLESTSCAFMNEEQLLAMGEHFTRLLSEVKHRGAFEQVYVGFCHLCSRIWSLAGIAMEDGNIVASTVHDLPVRWLNDLLDLISSTGDTYASRLCSTRRSAGVPFLVQALLSTQPSAATCTAVFQQCMEKLLSLAEGPCSINAKTHSLNILRAVFRCAALREPSVSYVTQSVKVAIYCCRAENWMVRNAATLLFSTLLIRLFGVGRPGSRLRRMTGRVFFHQYPLLFDFLLNEISTSSQQMCLSSTNSMHLFPALLLLSCLHPNSLEGTDSNLQLSHFVPLINACAGNESECIRKLAARALAPLVSPGEWADLVDNLLHSSFSETSWNRRHGLLLQVLSLLQTFSHKLIEEESLQKIALKWLSSTPHLLSINSLRIPCFLSVDACIQVVQILINSFLNASISHYKIFCVNDHETVIENKYDVTYDSLVSHQNEMPLFNHTCWLRIYSTIIEELEWLKHEKLNQAEPGLCLYQMRASQLLLMLTSVLEREKVITRVNEMLSSKIPDVVYIALKFVHFSLGHSSMRLHFEASTEELENTQIFPIFADAAPSLISSSSLAETIASLFFGNDCILLPDTKIIAFKLLNHLPLVIKYIAKFLLQLHLGRSLEKLHPGELVLEWLLKQLETDAEGVGPSVIALLGSIIMSVKHDNLFSKAGLCVSKSSYTFVCSTIENAASPECSLVLRMSVAEVISSKSFSLFLCNPPFQNCFSLALCHLWTAAIQLLDDDSNKIRSLVSLLAVEMIPDCKGIPVSETEARKLLVLKFVKVLEFHDSLSVAVSLTLWVLQHCNIIEENVSEEQLFDETETNMYGESLPLSLIASASLTRLVQQTPSLVKMPLENSVREWLMNHLWKGALLQKTVSQIPDFKKRYFILSEDFEWSTLSDLFHTLENYLLSTKVHFHKDCAHSEEIHRFLYPVSMYGESLGKRLSLLQSALSLHD